MKNELASTEAGNRTGRNIPIHVPVSSELKHFLQHFWNMVETPQTLDTADLSPKIEVAENKDAVTVSAELPGIDAKDIDLQISSDGYLTISASKNSSNEEKDEDGKYIRRERFYGNCSRSFYVGEAVTDADITAKFEDGILNLTIPKKEPEQIDTKSYIQIEG